MTWRTPDFLLHGSPRLPSPKPHREARTRISPARSHSALSAPTPTTAPASDRGPEGFDYTRAASLLADAAARAGAAIMQHYREPAAFEIKGDNSPVTRADRDSEAIILEALERLAPEVKVVSEETCGVTAGPLPRRFFLVDPLDGTKEFIQKRSDFTVNIALIEEGRPRFGLVYAPARALLAVTISPGRAVEVELPARTPPAPNWVAFARRRCVPGLPAAPVSPPSSATPTSIPRPKRSWPSSRLPRDRGSARPSSSLPSPGERRTSIRASVPPWNGIPRRARPCSRRRAAWSSTPAANRSAMARPRWASAIRASLPGAGLKSDDRGASFPAPYVNRQATLW